MRVLFCWGLVYHHGVAFHLGWSFVSGIFSSGVVFCQWQPFIRGGFLSGVLSFIWQFHCISVTFEIYIFETARGGGGKNYCEIGREEKRTTAELVGRKRELSWNWQGGRELWWNW